MTFSYNKKLIILLSFVLFGALIFLGFKNILPNKKEISNLNQPTCSVEVKEMIVKGNSLDPLIKSGEKVKALIGYYKCHPIKRNDVILYRYSGSKTPLIKIVKAIPGDRWSVKKIDDKCEIIVNNQVLKNSEGRVYLFSGNRCKMLSIYANSYPIVPTNAYLILGNNTSGSLDSTRFGLVGKKDIIGKVEK